MNDKQLIEVVLEREPQLTECFYENLFRRHPEVEPLFGRRSRAAQAKMLIEAVGAVVEHMDDPEWLRNTLRPLGSKHVSYGVTDEMYPGQRRPARPGARRSGANSPSALDRKSRR